MPLVYTGPPDVVDKYVQIYRNALPQDVASTARALDDARVFAEIVTMGEGTGHGWAREARLSTSHGIWTDQHALDHGTSRQGGEDDPALIARLKVGTTALLRQVLLDAANAILAAAGVAGTAALLELPRDAAHFGNYVAMTGTGGTFAQAGTVSKFTPTALPWPTPPFQAATVTPFRSWQLVISGASSSGNNGTRVVTGLEVDAAVVTNATGVAGDDPTVTWKAQRLDVTGNITDGFARAYFSRGYRMGQARPFELIMILPFGTDVGTANSIREALRVKKATGFKVVVERRMNP